MVPQGDETTPAQNMLCLPHRGWVPGWFRHGSDVVPSVATAQNLLICHAGTRLQDGSDMVPSAAAGAAWWVVGDHHHHDQHQHHLVNDSFTHYR